MCAALCRARGASVPVCAVPGVPLCPCRCHRGAVPGLVPVCPWQCRCHCGAGAGPGAVQCGAGLGAVPVPVPVQVRRGAGAFLPLGVGVPRRGRRCGGRLAPAHGPGRPGHGGGGGGGGSGHRRGPVSAGSGERRGPGGMRPRTAVGKGRLSPPGGLLLFQPTRSGLSYRDGEGNAVPCSAPVSPRGVTSLCPQYWGPCNPPPAPSPLSGQQGVPVSPRDASVASNGFVAPGTLLCPLAFPEMPLCPAMTLYSQRMSLGPQLDKLLPDKTPCEPPSALPRPDPPSRVTFRSAHVPFLLCGAGRHVQ